MKRREWLEGTRVRVTHSTLTLMSYPRPPPFAQVDHPSGFRLLFALPPDAATGTKVMLSVPACSGEIPALTAVKAEDVKHGTLMGRCVRVDVSVVFAWAMGVWVEWVE
mmetsp:Transcript_37411/g.101320  ORF Transcript_37411/g.101320 Transcript_37411/m.101320 type:complete len:108 (-) Transcript_37411:445-768(-)